MVIQWLFNGYSVVTFLLIIIDQSTKFIILNYFPQFTILNKGISFGLFPSNFWIFVNIIIIFILFFFKQGWSKSLIIAGGTSNIIDRFIRGSVVDYINIKIMVLDFSIPTFNLADVYICIGVGLIMTRFLKNKKN